ncbi:MAG: C-terminal helicase domain-containing protein, partial [Myxococcota bacterium]
MQLVDMLKDGELKDQKVMVFLNTVNDVKGATTALTNAGLEVVDYHAKLPLRERQTKLERFRKFKAEANRGDDDQADDDAVSILVCTDLAARGLDVPGVTAIVQLQCARNVVDHLHRMGRCGRAGQQDGRGIIFYDEMQRPLVEVIREAEQRQENFVLEQDVDDDAMIVDMQDDFDGNVKAAFSRKRGFRRRVKRELAEAERGMYNEGDYEYGDEETEADNYESD